MHVTITMARLVGLTLIVAIQALADDAPTPKAARAQRVEEAAAALEERPADPLRALALAKAYYLQAVEDEEDGLKQAERRLTRLHEAQPDDPIVRAYLGSTLLLKAKDTWAMWQKEKLSRRGLTLMDEAVQAAPDGWEVRFVRAMTTRHLPRMFERAAECEADFKRLAEHAPEALRRGTVEANFVGLALYHHGVYEAAAGRREAARVAWRSAVDAAPDTHAASLARQALSESSR